MNDRDVSSSRQLGTEMEQLTRQLKSFANPLAGDESLPAVQQLVRLASDIATSVAYALMTSGDPDTGRRNLLTLRQQATELARAAEVALRDLGTESD